MNNYPEQYTDHTVKDFKAIREVRLAWGRAVLGLLQRALATADSHYTASKKGAA